MLDVETLDVLKGEKEEKIMGEITMVRERKTCDFCVDPAHFKYTFLLPNCRSNPESKAYGHDDCTWCSDAEQFSCRNPECIEQAEKLEGYEYCAVLPAVERFAHIFLVWKDKDRKMSSKKSNEELITYLKTIKYELAALVEEPDFPDWEPCLMADNPADAKCLDNAWTAVCCALE